MKFDFLFFLSFELETIQQYCLTMNDGDDNNNNNNNNKTNENLSRFFLKQKLNLPLFGRTNTKSDFCPRCLRMMVRVYQNVRASLDEAWEDFQQLVIYPL